MHEPKYLSVADAARMLGVSAITIRRRIETGELPATQLGGPGTSIRIPARAIGAWLWANGEKAG